MQFDNFKIGEVSSINPARCTARVIFDDENSMVSYDNSAADVLFEPALTSIEQNVEELASAALDVLFRRIEEGERGELGEPEERILMPRLVIKDSVLAR